MSDRLGGVREALIVATSTYDDAQLARLHAPERDAANMADVLGNRNIGRFEVWPALIDGSIRDIQLLIGQFLRGRSVKDLVLVYLSCHGIRQLGKPLYFAARDTLLGDPAATAIESGWLHARLNECRARRQVVILDCCYSGAFVDGKGADARLVSELSETAEHSQGREVLAASRGTEPAFERQQLLGGGSGSLFTTALVEGLRTGNADTDRDGYISVGDAYKYALGYIDLHDPSQTPQRSMFHAEGEIWLAGNPRGTAARVMLPVHVRHAIAHPTAEVRLFAVSELAEWYESPDQGQAITARIELERLAKDEAPAVAAAARKVLAPAQVPIGGRAMPWRRSLSHPDWVRAVAFSPRGGLLASAGHDGGVWLWETDGEASQCLTGHHDWVLALAFSPDGSILASAGEDHVVRLWNPDDASAAGELDGHRETVNALAFSPDGTLASAATDGSVRLWDTASHRQVRRISCHGCTFTGLAFNTDGTQLAATATDGEVRIWSVADGRLAKTLTDQSGAVLGIGYQPGSRLLAAGGQDGVLRLWNIDLSEPIGAVAGHRGAIEAVAFSPDGALLASVGDDGDLRIWTPATRQLRNTLRGHRGMVRGLAFSPNGAMVATGGNDTTVRLWDLPPGPDADRV